MFITTRSQAPALKLRVDIEQRIAQAEAEEHTARLNRLRQSIGVRCFDGTSSDVFRANTEAQKLFDAFMLVMDFDDALEGARALVRIPPASLNVSYVIRNQGFTLQ